MADMEVEAVLDDDEDITDDEVEATIERRVTDADDDDEEEQDVELSDNDDEEDERADAINEQQESDAEPDNDGDEEEEEEVLTAVVVNDEDDDIDTDDDSTVAVVEAVAISDHESIKKKMKKSSNSTSSGTTHSSSKSSSNKNSKSLKDKSSGNASEVPIIKKLKSKNSNGKTSNDQRKAGDDQRKNKGRVESIDDENALFDSEEDLYRKVPNALIEAAKDARIMLQETVPVLPFPVAETQVRSLGRLSVQVGFNTYSKNGDGGNRGSKFCTASSLYPVGFSCDRFEFSPVHGRILKMRCSILDGRSVKAKQRDLIRATTYDDTATNPEASIITKVSNIHDGPVFRITWGRAVDDDPEKNAEYPYDPNIHSSPIIVNGKGKQKILQSNIGKEKSIKPEKGMRVKVRVDTDQYFSGYVTDAIRVAESGSTSNKKNKNRSNNFQLTVLYDYGITESFRYPDPDLLLVMPGDEDEIGPGGELELTELNGKPVESVVGESPLEAWGAALCRLGLIDEIMLKRALNCLNVSREEGLREAKDKQEGKSKVKYHNQSSNQDRKDISSNSNSPTTPKSIDRFEDGDDTMERRENSVALLSPDNRDPQSEREKALRERVQDLIAEVEDAKDEDRKAQVLLANARIRDLGPFLCNPFHDEESGKSQQASWLITAVKKEKTRMGSTGNKRKVVTALDLLERNDTFYNADIESLIEGLPGSELCYPYVFQAYRTGSGGAFSRSWAHEAQVKIETETLQVEQRRAKENQLKEEQDLEREIKKRKRDELRDERKMQKQAEEDEKKKARVDERLSRLEIQIKDRLWKEAAFQREKVIAALARSLAKELNRRRKAAELVAGQSVVDMKKKTSRVKHFGEYVPLPSISKVYDEDTVRVWNFVSTFQSFFLQRGYIQEVPSLDSLQTAVDCIRGISSDSSMSPDEAVSSLTDLTVALCKPLAASLTRVLFASLIALNPALQRDFGATFFNGVNATASGIEDCVENSGSPDVLLPVNSMTWPEIARLAFLSDALGEMGYPRHEAAHLLRGYRSAGHPNSKESKRLRKVEDVSIAILRQKVVEYKVNDSEEFFPQNRTRISIPCSPFALDKPSERATPGKWPWSSCDGSSSPSKTAYTRQRMGLLRWLNLPTNEYKKLSVEREQYMEDALKLKEEMDRAKLKEDDDEEDDDDDDEDDANAAHRAEGALIEDPNTAPQVENTVVQQNDTDIESNIPSEGQDSLQLNKLAWTQKIGKKTQYDDFCEDIPDSPDYIRRCLAVLRTLSTTGPAEPFLYPVDPQTNPGYYDMVVRPMCLREAGKQLKEAAANAKIHEGNTDEFIDDVVVQFGRNIRLISQNCLSYSNAGPTVIAAGCELLRIFERLFFDWVLAPLHLLPSLEDLDDDKCVEHHISDDEATVLFCDGCEGKYNITRLDPPLREIPNGDWYCPRCVNERWFGKVDPRIGKTVKKLVEKYGKIELSDKSGKILKCFFSYGEGSTSKPSLMYEILYNTGVVEIWPMSDVDLALTLDNNPVPPVRCVQAVAESPGYGFGVDFGLRSDVVPVPLNPNISDASAQVSLSSSVFRDTITASATLLLIDPHEMTATEWLRLLVLLVMKCSSSDVIQNVVSKMESDAAEKMAKPLESVNQIAGIQEILPPINIDYDDDPDESITGDGLEKDTKMPIHLVSSDAAPLKSINLEIPSDISQPVSSDLSMTQMRPVKNEDDENGSIEIDPVCSSENLLSGGIAAEDGDHPIDEVSHYTTAFIEKGKRQKAVEDSILAYCIKNQIKSTVASLEEDNVSPAVDVCLSTHDQGLQFSSLRCRQMACNFCGLSDIDLGLPLVRVPDENEWEEMFAHAARSRRTHLVAEIPSISTSGVEGESKLVGLKLMIGGELVSVPEKDLDEMVDGGMLEFAPRSDIGFQAELQFRSLYSLPFVTGSLSAHECCAIAAHNARKDLMVQKYKEHKMELVEKDAGMTCGRTLEIGRDRFGRSFWKFFEAPDTLFVCVEERVDDSKSDEGSGTWHHFSDAASIASLIISLRNDPIVRDLSRSYPDAHKIVRDGTWLDILMKRRYPKVAMFISTGELLSENDGGKIEDKAPRIDCGHLTFRVGDSVLVESQLQNLLWDAKVVAVSKRRTTETNDNGAIDAYRVEYKSWSPRFTEWVQTNRVFKPSNDMRTKQDCKFDERALSKCGLPTSLNQLVAKDYLHARDRVRENTGMPDFARIAHTRDDRLTNHKTFALMKAAVLAIEAALPVGSIDNSDFGIWRVEVSLRWRLLVINADGAAALMRCIILLEDTISVDWIKEDVGHLRSCLPDRWKAVAEASPSSLAIRVILLDRSIKYGKVDRKRFAKSKKKK